MTTSDGRSCVRACACVCVCVCARVSFVRRERSRRIRACVRARFFHFSYSTRVDRSVEPVLVSGRSRIPFFHPGNYYKNRVARNNTAMKPVRNASERSRSLSQDNYDLTIRKRLKYYNRNRSEGDKIIDIITYYYYYFDHSLTIRHIRFRGTTTIIVRKSRRGIFFFIIFFSPVIWSILCMDMSEINTIITY